MKRLLSIIVAVCMLISCFTAVSFAAPVKAKLSSQNLSVNGQNITCEKYNINDYNYFKLRDIAKLLSGTGSQFSVGWDDTSKTISITTGDAYTEVGGELAQRGDYSSTAKVSNQTILIDGQKVSDLSVYNIGDNNFFKLRDLGDALGFDVSYDGSTNTAVVESKNSRSVSFQDLCKAFNLPDNFSVIANPKTDRDYVNNFIYAYIKGNWEFVTEMPEHSEWVLTGNSNALTPYYDIVGAFMNAHPRIGYANGRYYICTAGLDYGATHDDLMKHMIESYNAASELKSKLHESGKITASSSDMDIVKAYADALLNYGIKDNLSKYSGPSVTIYSDSVYGCLVGKYCSCGGRAAAMLLLLHMEGITAASTRTTDTNIVDGGHVVVYAIIDGKEMLIDWADRGRQYSDPENPPSAVVVDEDNLKSNRVFFGFSDNAPSDVDPRVSCTYDGFDAKSGHAFTVKLDKSYNDYPDNMVVNMDYKGGFRSFACVVSDLKAGKKVHVSYVTAESMEERSYAMPDYFTISKRALSVAGGLLPSKLEWKLISVDSNTKKYSVKLIKFTADDNSWKEGYIYLCYGAPYVYKDGIDRLYNAYTYKQLTNGITVEYKVSDIEKYGIEEGFSVVHPW